MSEEKGLEYENKVLKYSIERILLGFTVYFGFFALGVIGKYAMPGHWISRVGELFVDWGTIVSAIGLLWIRRKMKIAKKKRKEEKENGN